jgi:predicted RNA-binding protein with PIN domain
MTRRRSAGKAGPGQTVIDGYNVIFRDPELRVLARTDLERARDELVRKLAESLYSRGGGITVVFDGREGGPGPGRTRSRGGVRVIFSSPPETADQRIQKLIESAGASGPAGARAVGWLVVSSDREVADRARLWGAKVESGEDFLSAIAWFDRPSGPESRRRPPMSQKELEEWERLFGRRKEGGEGGEGAGGGEAS